ncbi:hypothetical protein FRAHR75_680018 [Frankia sp. Hr75.2]|nr:hypothetical protein FRAHR75_680018 [Frankia sp. Hr75.2]
MRGSSSSSLSGLVEKSFDIPKGLVWEAYRRVAANKGAAGVDSCSVADFEKDLKSNLYRIWNRMSSGSYFPPPALAVEIPKPHGEGKRVLGVPTVTDRIAQTVAALGINPPDRVDFPFRLVWVSAWPFRAGRGRGLPGAVPVEELGRRC